MDNSSLLRSATPSVRRMSVVLLAAALVASLLMVLFASSAEAKKHGRHHHRHHALPAQGIQVSPDPVTFTPTSLTRDVAITNNTDRPVIIDPATSVIGSGFSLDPSLTVPVTIDPHTSRTVTIVATPVAGTGSLRILDASGLNVVKTVQLQGPLA